MTPMARDPEKAALALHRFGFGPRTGSIAAIASDPQGAVSAELDRPNAGQIVDPGLLSSDGAFRAVFEFNATRTAEAKLARLGRAADQSSMEPATETADKPDSDGTRPLPLPRRIFFEEATARIDAARQAEIGFIERLVWFWSNHFCVSLDASVMAGGYEREAIRPHVLGRFVDMLIAAESHPAMLIYLNNAQSIGPDSVAGINRSKGLNENFARELLELHTLGVRTGYTQADVVDFAKVLTGWTLRPAVSDPDIGGQFVFITRARTGRRDGAWKGLSRQRRRARARGTRRPRPPSRNCHAHRHQAGDTFHQRRPTSPADRSPRKVLSQNRWGFKGGFENAGDSSRSLDVAAGQAEAPGRMARCGIARHWSGH
jgi:uncharacterized protein (DUF1800 family)